ncbi:precorrin-2 C20-methyltransferase [Desulfatibacillum aliphaticivorans]|uniref:Precorrin-2 C20-methyltransferase n=1 Tax=Desulfatibacillum aliphaticivorans TaxID=218208 RepID=B8FH65_DESAL|nr:precorrin-2 C(20)-methyltransferase [Desulfatibacillum aliphaticivorans]ACL02153.1 precorrin-2 C20-methyltransferase [Desulfatibacillum aliphaticivorans]
MNPGTLYGIGVGPGDPDLITLKAARILGQVDVVFAASSTKNSHSQAVEIAKPHLKESVPIRMIPFPMTKNKDAMEKAWEKNAQDIIDVLEDGKSAAFITLGDCMTYSTFGYVLQNIQRLAPHIAVVSVPGITSYQAAASRLNTPLVEGEESLTLLSGVNGGGRFREISDHADNVVFLKAYKNAGDIAQALGEGGMDGNSVGVVKCGLEDEQIITDINVFREKAPNYWTLIISKKSKNFVAQKKEQ